MREIEENERESEPDGMRDSETGAEFSEFSEEFRGGAVFYFRAGVNGCVAGECS